MTNKDILDVALRQSAIDLGCRPEDFFAEQNSVVISRAHPEARKYLTLPFDCNIVYYGGSVVASVSEKYADIARAYIDRFPSEYLYEPPNLYVLDDMARPLGIRPCFVGEFFLPDMNALGAVACVYETRLLEPPAFDELYVPEWSNALCADRRQLDVLGCGAYSENGELIGLAACSADCDTMWQIGVDVLPAYRRCGIASALTSQLAIEIIKRGKVPFYCAAWSNIRSVRNAIRSGFRPAWLELTLKSCELVDRLNSGAE